LSKWQPIKKKRRIRQGPYGSAFFVHTSNRNPQAPDYLKLSRRCTSQPRDIRQGRRIEGRRGRWNLLRRMRSLNTIFSRFISTQSAF
jgi:hypothetical protein